jgi:hypothetical protein
MLNIANTTEIYEYTNGNFYAVTRTEVDFGKHRADLYTLKDMTNLIKLEEAVTEKNV